MNRVKDSQCGFWSLIFKGCCKVPKLCLGFSDGFSSAWIKVILSSTWRRFGWTGCAIAGGTPKNIIKKTIVVVVIVVVTVVGGSGDSGRRLL